jgi:acyl-CoA carboxylase subunit beta
MSILSSSHDPRTPTAQANAAAMDVALARLRNEHARNLAGGGAKMAARHLDRGKLLPRERLERLLDRDGWFLEVCPLAGMDIDGGKPGAGLIAGVGLVEGVVCAITASDPTLNGGAVNEWGVKKSRRMAEIVRENRLPSVSLIESAGADLPNQAQIFVPGGEGFRDLARQSADGLPSVCLVFGSSTAGGAYIPGMSEHTVMVRGQAQVYLAGPPLVKMAIGEDVDDETLGGAAMHAAQSGLCDHLAEDEADAIRIGRRIVRNLGWSRPGADPRAVAPPPRFDPAELRGIASSDVRVPFPAREVIARIVDDSDFDEHRANFGRTLVTGFAQVHGYPVGVIASDGVLFADSSEKGAHFIGLCNQRDIPLLFLQNIVGFMVGSAVEQAGITRAGAKLIAAVSNSQVPAITVMTGASYGAGNYAMCGRAYHPRFLYTWPNHRIAVMGGEQLAGVLDLVKRQSAARRGDAVDEEQLGMMKQMIQGKIEIESTAWYASARLWDDGIIDPADTRDVVGASLATIHSAPIRGSLNAGVVRH